MKTIRFGIIGCGLMGREFASAAARWCHLPEMDVRPEIVAVCDPNAGVAAVVRRSISRRSASRRPTTASCWPTPEVEAVYCAVPHNLHQEIYCAAIEAGKHLMGEKPFGIDKPANDAILACVGAASATCSCAARRSSRSSRPCSGSGG